MAVCRAFLSTILKCVPYTESRKTYGVRITADNKRCSENVATTIPRKSNSRTRRYLRCSARSNSSPGSCCRWQCPLHLLKCISIFWLTFLQFNDDDSAIGDVGTFTPLMFLVQQLMPVSVLGNRHQLNNFNYIIYTQTSWREWVNVQCLRGSPYGLTNFIAVAFLYWHLRAYYMPNDEVCTSSSFVTDYSVLIYPAGTRSFGYSLLIIALKYHKADKQLQICSITCSRWHSAAICSLPISMKRKSIAFLMLELELVYGQLILVRIASRFQFLGN